MYIYIYILIKHFYGIEEIFLHKKKEKKKNLQFINIFISLHLYNNENQIIC